MQVSKVAYVPQGYSSRLQLPLKKSERSTLYAPIASDSCIVVRVAKNRISLIHGNRFISEKLLTREFAWVNKPDKTILIVSAQNEELVEINMPTIRQLMTKGQKVSSCLAHSSRNGIYVSFEKAVDSPIHPFVKGCIKGEENTDSFVHVDPELQLIIGKKTNTILCMEKPPGLGGQLMELTHKEFKAKFNCEYSEGLYDYTGSLASMYKNQKRNSQLLNAAYARLQNPLKSLVICKISPEVGYGLFTLKPIKRNTVIFIYSGIQTKDDVQDIVYTSAGNVNARHIGGMARFMNHLPNSKEEFLRYHLEGLKDPWQLMLENDFELKEAIQYSKDTQFYEEEASDYIELCRENHEKFDFDAMTFFNPEIKTNIATSNVRQHGVFIDEEEESRIVLFLAKRDIEANEIIGFSYGTLYWGHPTVSHPPVMFTKYGEVIPAENNYVYLMPSQEKVNEQLPPSMRLAIPSSKSELLMDCSTEALFRNIFKNASSSDSRSVSKPWSTIDLTHSTLSPSIEDFSAALNPIWRCSIC